MMLHPTPPGSQKVKRLHWSMVTSFWVAIGIMAVATVTVLVLMHKPVWIELETLAMVVGVLFAGFYTFVLYHGVSFSDNETISLTQPVGTPLDLADIGPQFFGRITMEGASEGPLGLLLAFLLDVLICLILSVVLAFLIWLGVNLMLLGVITIAVPFFYIFRRSVLFVMRHGAECSGNLWLSMRYGLSYAAAKTALLCAIVFVSHELAWLIRIYIFRKP